MNSSVPDQHREQAAKSFRCAVMTVSDTRTPETDRGGNLVAELLTGAGHEVADRVICRDEPSAIRAQIAAWQTRELHAVLLTGGTGIAPRDRTYETICELLTKTVPGYGELFRALSYQEIGAAAMLSRAVGGLLNEMVLLTMPGSPAAVRLAMEKLILPELGHLVQQARAGT